MEIGEKPLNNGQTAIYSDKNKTFMMLTVYTNPKLYMQLEYFIEKITQ